MQITTNYGLKKPEASDAYNKENDNDNMDVIDTQLKANADAAEAAETPAGAQVKADVALGAARDYTDQKVGGITPASIGAETPAGATAKAAAAIATANDYTEQQINDLTKGDVGLSNVDNVKQATKAELDTHLAEDATTTIKGHVKVGSNINVSAGTISVPNASTSTRGAVQLSTATNSTSTILAATASAVKASMDRANEAFQSASDGKALLAPAITGKGVPTQASDTFAMMASKIGQINTGKKWASGNFSVYDKPGDYNKRINVGFRVSTAIVIRTTSGMWLEEMWIYGDWVNGSWTANGGKMDHYIRANQQTFQTGRYVVDDNGFDVTINQYTPGQTQNYQWIAFE